MNAREPATASTGSEVPVEAWVAALIEGDRRALARCITWVENQTSAGRGILGAIQSRLGVAVVVGFTGSPGVGKSTLVNAFIAEWRRRGKTVAVAAVDPSSPYSGGAILGDRIRMGEHASDPGVFIRSISSRGQVGGLSLSTARIVDVMDAAGFDMVIVETVGAGQSEHDIADLADIRIVVCTPGQGDEVQMAKAGILEIADILVVNKFDLPGAERMAAQLAETANLGRDEPVPILGTTASTGDGIAALVDTVLAQVDGRVARRAWPNNRTHRLLASMAGRELERRLLQDASAQMRDMYTRVAGGTLDLTTAIDELLAWPQRSGRGSRS